MFPQLLIEIKTLFTILRTSRFSAVSEQDYYEMLTSIRSRQYRLSPLKVVTLPKGEGCPPLIYHVFKIPAIPNDSYGCMVDAKDDLLFMALSRVLTKSFLTSSSLFRDKSFAFRIDRDEADFRKEICSWGAIDMLLYVDMTPSLSTLCRTRLLSKLQPFMDDAFLFNLMHSFLDITFLDENQKEFPLHFMIPPVGVLTFVLHNFYLEQLDRKIVETFHDLYYARFIHEFIMAIPYNAGVNHSFTLNRMISIFSEYSLTANIVNVVRGGFPIPCVDGMLSVDESGVIHFLNQE